MTANNSTRFTVREDAVISVLKRGPATSVEIGSALGVSTRTVLRIIESLRDQGIRIESATGPGGGFALNVSPRRTGFYIDPALALRFLDGVAGADNELRAVLRVALEVGR